MSWAIASLDDLALQRPNRNRSSIIREKLLFRPGEWLPQLHRRLLVLPSLARHLILRDSFGDHDEGRARNSRGEIAADRHNGIFERDITLCGAFGVEVQLDAGDALCGSGRSWRSRATDLGLDACGVGAEDGADLNCVCGRGDLDAWKSLVKGLS